MKTAIYLRANDILGHAYNTQIRGANNLLEEHPEWDEQIIYSDIGDPDVLNDQNGLRELLQDAASHSFDVVLFPSASRVSDQLPTLRRIIKTLYRHGINVYFTNKMKYSFLCDISRAS